jgi:hypothetical protein
LGVVALSISITRARILATLINIATSESVALEASFARALSATITHRAVGVEITLSFTTQISTCTSDLVGL